MAAVDTSPVATTTRPRKVSFSDTSAASVRVAKVAEGEGDAVSARALDTPPPARRLRFQRTPFPAAGKGTSVSPAQSGASSTEYESAPSSPVAASTPPQEPTDVPPPPAATPPRRSAHQKHESLGDVFLEHADVPRPPTGDIASEYPSLESESASPFVGTRTLPRVDFSRGSTPHIARGGSAFTPRPLKRAVSGGEFSPSRVPGRQISLSDLGAAYAAVAADELAAEEEDAMEELDDFEELDDGDMVGCVPAFVQLDRTAPPLDGLSAAAPHFSEANTPEVDALTQLLDTSDEPVMFVAPTARQSVNTEDAGPLDSADSDADEVDLELDIASLSLTAEDPSDTDSGSAPTTPDPNSREMMFTATSPAMSLDTMAKSVPGTPLSNSASIQIMSPVNSPPPLVAPSVPATPNYEATGYFSDESDSWVLRRRGAGRRVIASDDEDEAPRRARLVTASTPGSRGLRGRVPAAIAQLDALPDFVDGYDATEELVDDIDDENDESIGSLRDFIVNSDDEEDVEVIDVSDGEDTAADSEFDSDDDPVYTGPAGIPIINLISDSEDDGIDEGAVLNFLPPRAPIRLPDLTALTLEEVPISSPRKRPQPKRATQSKGRANMSKKAWLDHGLKYARDLFDEIDERVFGSRLGKSGAGCTVIWNNRILTAAGYAHGSRSRRVFQIKLGPKVLDTEAKIRDTLAHEMCHIACYAISDEWRNPHGKAFKSWGRKVSSEFPDITVTTKHDYELNKKFEWRCSSDDCTVVYKRYSKSIDIARHRCGRCRSPLIEMFETKTSPYHAFLGANMKYAKASMPGASHGDIMRALAARWSAAPDASLPEHQAHWASLNA